ncbi:MAG: GDP-L-fucose synthase family protein [Crocinitomicaceae bacterium]
MNRDAKIYVAGHRGMVGSAIVRKLKSKGFNNIIIRTSADLDLRNQEQVNLFFENAQPEYVFLAAAKVGGIQANNTYRADFLYDNLMITTNVINAAFKQGVSKLLNLGSSCIYPKKAPQPLKEEYLLTGALEQTNEPYAIAKIAGIKMCETYRDQFGANFISAMPTNLYGPNDNYDLNNSHVLPALIKKCHQAKINNSPFLEIWGSGEPMREFLHVDDLAEACMFLMLNYNEKQFVNLGSGQEISIKDLALLIKKVVGFEGELKFDASKPNGTMRKLMDVSYLEKAGWKYSIELEEGIKSVYEEARKAGKLD